MCHGSQRRRGYGRHFGRRRFDREAMLPRLEEYQRDLEQELADVADLIKRLKEKAPKETATV